MILIKIGLLIALDSRKEITQNKIQIIDSNPKKELKQIYLWLIKKKSDKIKLNYTCKRNNNNMREKEKNS